MKNNASLSYGFSTVGLAIIASLVILLGAGIFYIVLNGPTLPSTTRKSSPGSTNAASQQQIPQGDVTSTIPDIVGRGQSLECDWKLPVDSAENPFNKGKLWTNGNKGRSHITATIGGMETEANAIYQNNTAYTWMTFGGQTFGMKFSPSELEEANRSMSQQERQQAEQIRQSMIFNCEPWQVDDTKFTLPSDVNFDER